MSSFFEKLTGASEEKIEVPEIKIKEPKTRSKSTSSAKPIKKTMPKKIEEPKMVEPEKEEEEKDWLDEAEGEEGQLTIDVYQTETDVVIKSTIAGVSPDDIDIGITNDMVTVRGRRVKDEQIEAENYYYQELYWGTFSRSVILPVEVDADKAKAGIKNGILTIKLPKIEKVKTKKIKVKALE